METRQLGRTGLEVSVLSLGGLYTSSLAGGDAATLAILERAAALGIQAIDTAPAYADSEATLGRALAQLAHPSLTSRSSSRPWIVTTKLGGRPQPFDPQNAVQLRASVEESLRLLRRECIDVLMIHEPDRPLQYAWWTNYDPLEGPVLDVMRRLQQEGKVRYLGLGGTTATEMASLLKTGLFDVVLTAFQYNVLVREAEQELFPAAQAHNLGVVAGSVLGQGFLARRFDAEVQRKPIWLSHARQQQMLGYYALLDDTGLSPVAMGLRFALSNPTISTIPLGCKTVEQLEASAQAIAQGPLPADVLQRLDALAALVPYRPFEEPMILPFGKAYYGPGMANIGAAVPVGKLDLSSGSR